MPTADFDTALPVGDAAFGTGRLPPRVFASPPPLSAAAHPNGDAAGKHWSQSMTVWGTVLQLLTVGLPILGPAFGIPITPEIAKVLGEQLVQLIQAAGVVAGTGMIVAGRARASGPLERRAVTLRL